VRILRTTLALRAPDERTVAVSAAKAYFTDKPRRPVLGKTHPGDLRLDGEIGAVH